MALLKRRSIDPIEQLETELAAAISRRDALKVKLASAETVLVGAIETRRATLVEGDADDVEPGKVAHLRDERDALTDAIEQVEARVVHCQSRLAQERDKAAREKAARELRAHADALAAAVDEFAAASTKLAAAMHEVVKRLPLANVEFPTQAAGLLSEIATVARGLARNGGSKVVESVIRAPSVAPPAPPAPPAIERRAIYTTQHIRWTEPDGEITAVCEHSQAHPPIALADRAVARNVALYLDTPHAQAMIQAHGQAFGPPPRLEICADLDCLPEVAAPAPEKTSEAVAG